MNHLMLLCVSSQNSIPLHLAMPQTARCTFQQKLLVGREAAIFSSAHPHIAEMLHATMAELRNAEMTRQCLQYFSR